MISRRDLRMRSRASSPRPWGTVTDQQKADAEAAKAALKARQLANRLVKRRQRSVSLVNASDAQLHFVAQHQKSDDELDDQAYPGSSDSEGPSTSTSRSKTRRSHPYSSDRYTASLEQIVKDRELARPILQRHFEDSVPGFIQEYYTKELQRKSSLCRRVTEYTAQPFHSCKGGDWSCGDSVFVKHRLVNYYSLEHFLQVNVHELRCKTCKLEWSTPSTVLW